MKDQIISLHETQKAWLEAKARELGISQTEVIRRMIDDVMGTTLRSGNTLHPYPENAVIGQKSGTLK
jgi:hypothetical protein